MGYDSYFPEMVNIEWTTLMPLFLSKIQEKSLSMVNGQKESNASSEGLCARKFSITECSAYTEYLPDHEMNFSVKIYTKAFPSAS